MTTVEILKEMAFTATETQRRALEDAISVLSAEGDLISRQAVIDALTKTSGIRGDALKALYDLQSVENKGEDRPKGHWIYWSNSPFRWECDKCGGLFKTDFNFCPNCGADMRGET